MKMVRVVLGAVVAALVVVVAATGCGGGSDSSNASAASGGECKAGDYVWRPAGSRHTAWVGPQGALVLAIFQIPNRFFEEDGRETDVLGQDWEKAWGAALFRDK